MQYKYTDIWFFDVAKYRLMKLMYWNEKKNMTMRQYLQILILNLQNLHRKFCLNPRVFDFSTNTASHRRLEEQALLFSYIALSDIFLCTRTISMSSIVLAHQTTILAEMKKKIKIIITIVAQNRSLSSLP